MSDLNHPKVKPLTREIALALGLEAPFVAFLFAESHPKCFDYWVESPDRGWTCFVPTHVKVAYPLWSTNADQTLVCVGSDRRWFMRGHHDESGTYDLANTVQGLLATVFFTLYESEATVDELRQAADACGFRYVEDVIRVGETRQDDYWTERERTIHEIDAKVQE